MKTSFFFRKSFVLILLVSLLFLTSQSNPIKQAVEENKIEQSSSMFAYHDRFYPGAVIKKTTVPSPPSPPKTETPIKEISSTSFTVQKGIYRKRIDLSFANNKIEAKNHIISLKINTYKMLTEVGFPFTVEQLFFTASDGKTRLNHWIVFGFGKQETKIWLQLPTFTASKQYTVYVVYGPGIIGKQNSYESFLPSIPPLIAFYYFDDVLTEDIQDLSNHQHNAKLKNVTYDGDWRWGMNSVPLKQDRSFPMMYNWKYEYADTAKDNSTYFYLPLQTINLLHQEGSIETNVNPYSISEAITQVLFTDQSHQIVFGLLPDRKPYFQLGTKANRIVWNTILQDHQWHRLVLTWDLIHNQVLLFVNGKKAQLLPTKSILYFRQIQPISAIQLGGVPCFQKEYGFNGLVEYFRLYSKSLTVNELIVSQRLQAEKNRFPDKHIGKMETIRIEKSERMAIPLVDTSSIPLNKQMKINMIYCNPANDYYQYNTTVNDPVDPSVNMIDRLSEKELPIFGVNSHFWSNAGTSTKVEENFMVLYVGLKINEPSLVQNFSISFDWIASYDEKEYSNEWYRENFYETSEGEETGWLDWLIPSAKACGPFYSFFQLGESKLVLLGLANGITWYRLEHPIFVNPSIRVLQLSYCHTNQLGYLTVQMMDILCLNDSNQFIRAQLLYENDENFMQMIRGKDEIAINPEYRAKLLLTEKGAITFEGNDEQGINLVFKNTGIDPITIDNGTLLYFENYNFYGLSIYDNQDNLISDTTIKEMLKPIMGMTFQPGESLCYQFLYSFQLKQQTIYRIFLSQLAASNYCSGYNKIISWTIGDDPFEYRYHDLDSHIQSFWVDSDKRIHISDHLIEDE